MPVANGPGKPYDLLRDENEIIRHYIRYHVIRLNGYGMPPDAELPIPRVVHNERLNLLSTLDC